MRPGVAGTQRTASTTMARSRPAQASSSPAGSPSQMTTRTPGRWLPFDLGGGRRTYSVVAAIAVAYPDDHRPDGARGYRLRHADHAAHWRRTLRVRKWAAQEMQGS